jgi:hypothetical protein
MPSSGLHKFKLKKHNDGIYAETCSLNENKLIKTNFINELAVTDRK